MYYIHDIFCFILICVICSVICVISFAAQTFTDRTFLMKNILITVRLSLLCISVE